MPYRLAQSFNWTIPATMNCALFTASDFTLNA